MAAYPETHRFSMAPDASYRSSGRRSEPTMLMTFYHVTFVAPPELPRPRKRQQETPPMT